MPRTRSLAWAELKIGITAVTAVVLAILLISAVGGQAGFLWQQYQLFTVFSNVQGLKAGAVVRLAGVEVGPVADIEFAGSDVKVTMDIVGEGTVGRLFTEDDLYRELRGVADAAGDLVDRIRQGRGTVGQLVRDPAPVPQSQRSRPQPATDYADARARRRQLRPSALGRGVCSRADRDGHEPARAHGGHSTRPGDARTARQRSVAVQPAGRSTARLKAIAARVHHGEGTIGRLVQDPELYANINAAARELRALISDIRKDPRKYLNVRVSLF